MSPLLNVIVALGGASFAWRAYSALYERQRSRSHAPDPVTDTWWRILSMAVAGGLFSFLAGGGRGAGRGAPGVGGVLLFLFAPAAALAGGCAAPLWRPAPR